MKIYFSMLLHLTVNTALGLTHIQWKRINHKQSIRWQHLSRLKASAFFSLQKYATYMKRNNIYSGLVMPSSG